jgi:hydrogenase-4 component B
MLHAARGLCRLSPSEPSNILTIGGPTSMFLPVLLYAAGAMFALAFGRRALGLWGGHLAAALGGLTGFIIALRCLLGWNVERVGLGAPVPFATLAFRLDGLSAFFLLIISLVAVAAALYAPGYIADGHGSARGLGVALNGFLAAMVLVVLADSVLAFMLAWELMSLVSFFLVVEDHHQAEARQAGFVYLVMTHTAGAFLLCAFLLLSAQAGSLEFDALRAAAPSLPAPFRDLVFLAALVGFGTKAGIIPLHVWLPRAHPAAPSYASALMSGVMLKMGVYGLLRVAWELAGPGPAWWGGLLLALGATSAVLGVLSALVEHDLKRLLAYHSVENVGIVFLGIGAGLLLAALGQPGAAAFALAAGLFHALNHAAFKGLLFLSAGAVLQAVHTRDLENMGGLIHRMPWTAAAFLLGAAAISALPPLNGFASEWLTLQALLLLGQQAAPIAVGGAVAAGLLALTSGLALFCFVKAFGVAFLGTGRRPAADAAYEVGIPMRAGMLILALACVALGLFPSAVLRLLDPVTTALVGAGIPPPGALTLAAPSRDGALFSPIPVLLALVALGGLALVLGRLRGGPVGTRVAPTWVCGVALEPRMQYSAAAFSKPIRIIFRFLLRPYRKVELEHVTSPHFVSGVRFEAGQQPVYEPRLYHQAVGLLLRGAHGVRVLQNGSLRLYLTYMFATLVVALLVAR